MRKGKIHLAYAHFLGYRKGADGRPEIVEEEARIVRMIYDLFLSGMTIRHIAEHLTNKGIPTPTGKSKWSVSTVQNILTNEKYKGEALLQKTYTEDYLRQHRIMRQERIARHFVSEQGAKMQEYFAYCKFLQRGSGA